MSEFGKEFIGWKVGTTTIELGEGGKTNAAVRFNKKLLYGFSRCKRIKRRVTGRTNKECGERKKKKEKEIRILIKVKPLPLKINQKLYCLSIYFAIFH